MSGRFILIILEAEVVGNAPKFGNPVEFDSAAPRTSTMPQYSAPPVSAQQFQAPSVQQAKV